MRMAFAATVIVSVLAGISRAQTPGPIVSTVNEVIVPVTVTDDKGRFVSDLDEKDFRIYDQGKEQKISYFTDTRLPKTKIFGSIANISAGVNLALHAPILVIPICSIFTAAFKSLSIEISQLPHT